jgi:hypothetical protein
MAENKKAQRKKKLGKNKKNDDEEEICKEKTPKIAEISSPKK